MTKSMDPATAKNLIADSKNRVTTTVGYSKTRNDDTLIGIEDSRRTSHVFNAGPTDSGKTVLLTNVSSQDIVKGRGVGVLIPAGDAVDRLLEKIPQDRQDDVIYLNPNKEPVTRINVLQPHITDDMTYAETQSQREMITSDVVDLFERFAGGDLDTRYAHHLRTLIRAHLELNIRYGQEHTLVDVYHCITDPDQLEALMEKVSRRVNDAALLNQLATIKNDLSSYELGPLQWRLEVLVQNATVNSVIDAGESSVDFRDLVRNGKILLVDLKREHIGPDAAQIIGSLVTTQLWAAAQSQISLPEDERQPFYLFVDEIHNFSGKHSNFTKMLPEARKYGLGLWLACQHLGQLDTALEEEIQTNCRTKIFFETDDVKERRKIASMLPGLDQDHIKKFGQYRAAMTNPESESAVTFNTLPPWDGGRSEDQVEQLKLEATVADENTPKKAAERDASQDEITEEWKHQQLLDKAIAYLEDQPEVDHVIKVGQEIGTPRPDGEIVKTNGAIAHLEAESTTTGRPVKVLRNLRKAVDRDRKYAAVVEAAKADRLENIITDPVNRRGDDHEDEHGTFSYYIDEDGEPFNDISDLADAAYRILVLNENGKIMDHANGREADCPKLAEHDKQELLVGCPWREDDMCLLLDAPCVFRDEPEVEAA